MRKLIVLLAVLAGFLDVSGRALQACGAKFIVSPKAPRFPLAQHTLRPATILLYQHNTDAGVVEFIAELRRLLNGVGHRATIVTSEDALRGEVGRQRFDVVMMQLDAARRLRSDLTSWSNGAAILPMKEYVPGAEAARVRKEFGQLLKLPASPQEVVSVVQSAHR